MKEPHVVMAAFLFVLHFSLRIIVCRYEVGMSDTGHFQLTYF